MCTDCQGAAGASEHECSDSFKFLAGNERDFAEVAR
jgi:hypothetical protein